MTCLAELLQIKTTLGLRDLQIEALRDENSSLKYVLLQQLTEIAELRQAVRGARADISGIVGKVEALINNDGSSLPLQVHDV